MLKKAVVRDSATGAWLTFVQPVDTCVAQSPAEVADVVTDVFARAEAEGLYVCGYLSYEAASAFDSSLATHTRSALPLAVFALFHAPQQRSSLPDVPPHNAADAGWALDTARADYRQDIAAIRRHIELGNCYQVNYTVRQTCQLQQSPWAYFLTVAADAPYAAFLDCTEFAVVSASPELFFSLHDQTLRCRPMKGTARRGLSTEGDRENAAWLRASRKNRAENVMITDMVRNDLGRVARPGTVIVDSLYDIEKYPTVWQMTSSVSAKTDATLPEIFAALFPPASITGAPKAASMQLIADLERTPREIYTGAIGYASPQRHAQFNVAIRTTWIDKQSTCATYGVGSGIVWDSNAEEEYEECLIKARVLTASSSARDFRLLETLLWTPEVGYELLEEHLDRLGQSAEYFDFTLDPSRVRADLSAASGRFDRLPYRVRLEVDRDGAVHLEQLPLPKHRSPPRQRLRLASQPIDRNDPFLYHKTTFRDVYQKALSAAGDCDDVLLWNEDGYLTETSIANVIVQLDGARVTPPVTCGLLGGTYRRSLLRKGQLTERRVHLDELPRAERVTLINSVRGEYPVDVMLDS